MSYGKRSEGVMEPGKMEGSKVIYSWQVLFMSCPKKEKLLEYCLTCSHLIYFFNSLDQYYSTTEEDEALLFMFFNVFSVHNLQTLQTESKSESVNVCLSDLSNPLCHTVR